MPPKSRPDPRRAHRKDPFVLARRGISARWAPVGLGLVLLLLTGFAMWAALSTGNAANQVARANHTAAAFDNAHYAVSEQESLERKYRLEPSALVRGFHFAAGIAMTDALKSASRTGTPRELRVVHDALTRYDAYLKAVRRVFAAEYAGRDAVARRIDLTQADPPFAMIGREVTGGRNLARADARRAVRKLQHAEAVALVATPIVFTFGLLLLGLLTWVLVDAARRNRDQAAASRHQALHDALTALPNRILFDDRLEQALRHAEREREPLAVLMIDLDRFKEVNDTMGHANGDLLLRLVGPRLRAVLRARDTIARWAATSSPSSCRARTSPGRSMWRRA